MGTAHYFDGLNGYAVISPFTVYGWSEITIAELFYPVNPKTNTSWTKFSMIGDYWTDHPSIFWGTNNATNYTSLGSLWCVRKPDGTNTCYGYGIMSYVNKWVFVTQRFTSAREYAVYVNGQKKYSTSVPSDYKTVLEWNPDTATYPSYYKRFVLGANVGYGEKMTMYQAMLLIYNRALSDSEIQQIYNTPSNPPTTGLVLWFDNPDFTNDCCKAIWRDKSGNGNNGKLYNVQMAYY
ncbi:MAG: hypothetical protein ACP5HH_07220 [Fervidicoccaceae archaeon]